jgi:hypothetical protein
MYNREYCMHRLSTKILLGVVSAAEPMLMRSRGCLPVGANYHAFQPHNPCVDIPFTLSERKFNKTRDKIKED